MASASISPPFNVQTLLFDVGIGTIASLRPEQKEE
jgi:hypothetical protein